MTFTVSYPFTWIFRLITIIAIASCQLPTEVEQAQLLEAHLQARENVYPPASDMLLMEYSKELETLADSWAKECNFSLPNLEIHPQYRDLIQNTVLISGVKPPFTEGLCSWRKEAEKYNYQDNSCSGVCGHYTQMIWATTDKVGCAMRQCDGLRSDWDNPQYLIVCQYSPGGNYVGQKPYEYGPSCSKCPRGHSCYRNQCIKQPTCNRVHPTLKLKNYKDRAAPECVVFKD
ncbi:unnamed protein product [Hydatigera taeniaeformis]|uniref:SCP domain-containing protein n=1 Tax=Hydatigena taeniaeformis TaxID=6205 RepID=A0A0R3WV86_HYDTA|nr:unnamed protein product [Hydatigera taeniaeformis]